MSSKSKNIGASVRQRILNMSRKSGTNFSALISSYAFERLLYRLSRSQHRDRFVLKGAMLFRIWSDEPHRTTRDMDLLAFGNPAAEEIVGLFREMCALVVEDDGVTFQLDSIRTEDIREAQEYDGVRVKLNALIGGARLPLHIDVGFGDSVVPPAEEMTYPTLLEFPTPHIRAYARETVIAEKFHAMVALDIANSRMKDFYDIYSLAMDCEFSGNALCSAIKATFGGRSTPIPSDPPIALTEVFCQDSTKISQWQAFASSSGVKTAPVELSEVVELISTFLLRPANSARIGEQFTSNWIPPGPWKP